MEELDGVIKAQYVTKCTNTPIWGSYTKLEEHKSLYPVVYNFPLMELEPVKGWQCICAQSKASSMKT